MAARDADLLERFRRWRDRLLASPRFQRRAAAFPLTRPIARRRARQLFDLCAGFVYSQVLLAGVRVGLFDALRDGARSAAEVAPELGLPVEGAERLLRAAAALGLTEHRGGGRFGLGPLGAPLLGNVGLQRLIEHHGTLYADLEDPVALLGGAGAPTGLARYWSYAAAADPAALADRSVRDYTALMAASQSLVSEDVLAVYDFGRHRRLLDVGGGDGAFCAAVAARHPALEVMSFDLPAVAAVARERYRAAGLDGRAAAHGGDFFVDPLPDGADLVSFVRVIHDHDDDRALALLRAARRALPPDGRLLIAEQMAETPGAEPVGDAYFGFYLLAMGSGRPRSFAALGDLVERAGFAPPRELPTRLPLQARVLLARPAR